MARVKNRVACYYWESRSTGRRESWNFPSRKEAEKWRDWECKRYTQYGSLETMLENFPESQHTQQTELWKRHRDKYLDWTLNRGIFEMNPKKWKYEE